MSKPFTTKYPWTNFRDLGGLECIDGKRIKPGKIYRSPVLAPAGRAQREFLDSLNLDAILDLRTRLEVDEKKDYVPAGCEYFNLPAYSEIDFPHLPVSKKSRKGTLRLRGEQADRLVEEKRGSYQEMPFSKQAFSKVFELMDQGKTFLFHCTAGKDRTGVCAMLIELALGRSIQNVRIEYLRSDQCEPPHRRNALRWFGASPRLIDAIYYCEGVHAELLELSLQAMLDRYKTAEQFLLQEYKISPLRVAKWKEFYLE